MQKKKIIVISLIAIMFIFISIMAINYDTNYSYIYEKDGIKYAVTLDGVVQTSFPSKGLYKVDVTCENATCKWLYDEWKLAIENITGNVSCDIDFVTISKTYLNDYILGLTGTEQGTGQVVNENGYRYEGKNPNNYIWFNNELWRIIGVFDSETHGQSNTNLVKIIRADSIDALAWDKSGTNNWKNSSLNSLLNGVYLNAQDGTNSEYCYMFFDSVPANCNYQRKGIQDEYRGMIQNVTWHLGGYIGEIVTADAYYGYERGTTVYSGNPTSTTGYIGLMYPSDYGYSVLSSGCARTTNLKNYDSSSCGGQSWIVENATEWVLFPMSSNSSLVFYLSYGSFTWDSSPCGYSRAVRPVLYLKSDVYYIEGDGSILDPIIIGM